ncbi:F0F1 ATP synthase subunit epsilon [Roseibacterium sp. SDUM158016]|jgi:F-type H+-transporting ATPase subunit epsilon|uniref:F0F1 ATP synthase subunit epsilon n=1 Tax=Roseicyclus sediminis TaxID=2980997 RepID=UPI0021D1F461|nr:F0F1 ATP synthase subunit epsilon [Roseibacterium sp. SDUM158016]MCU4654911.1 F0F1 ATP synthase subunit epsilon [Roseibacterium sp. SDUM158016]
MADTMQFDLVSPERRLASLQATEVRIPGAEGDMTAMADHAPTITTLRPGILSVTHAGGTEEYVVLGGFADISGKSVTVLAERAMPSSELTRDAHNALIEEYRAAHDKAKETFHNEPGPVDDAAKLLADMVALGDRIGG